MIYLTSDHHFYHKKIIQLAKRPFANVEEMNRELFKRWNQTVTKEDTVYYLGDLSWLSQWGQNRQIFEKLNFKELIFIKGNHDDFLKEFFVQESANLNIEHHPFFKATLKLTSNKTLTIMDYCEFFYENQRFILFHYPIASFNGMYRGTIHVHGHTHSPYPDSYSSVVVGLPSYNVSVEANDYTPVSIDKIIKVIKNARELQE